MNMAYKYVTRESKSSIEQVYVKIKRFITLAHAEVKKGNYTEKAYCVIKLIFEFMCSSKFISNAKLVFGAIIAFGFLGIIKGSSLAPLSIVSGCVCLALVIFLEYVTDEKSEQSYFN